MKNIFLGTVIVTILVIIAFWLGQYTGAQKMLANAAAVNASLHHAYLLDLHKYPSLEEKLIDRRRKDRSNLAQAIRTYDDYKSHWSSKLPSINNLDSRTESIISKARTWHDENPI